MKNIGILLACSLLLFGCGSTSDSSTGSAASSGSGGVTYTGSTTPATITSGNAISLTGVVVQSKGSSKGFSSLASSMYRSNTGAGSMSMLDAAIGVVATANEALTQQKQPKLAAGAVQTNTYTQNCSGQGTMTITVSKDNVTGLGSISFTFSNCNMAPEIMNGSMSVNVTAVDANNNPTSMSIQFDNLTITDAVGTNYMNGTISVSSTTNTAGGTTDTLAMTFVMRDSSGNVAKMDNFQYIANTDAGGNMVSEEMSGRVFESASGYVDITTTSPLIYSPAGSTYPSSGGPVIFAGANNTKVRITPVDATNVLIEADTTGDGNYDFSQQKAWSAL